MKLFLAAALALAIGAPAAQAGLLVSSAPSCADQTFEQPFLPWLDPASYVLAPDGTFEAGAEGWDLSGAEVVSGNEPFYVHGTGESRSLSLPAGSSATSPAMCVGIEHPTLRFFAERSGGPFSALLVEVLFEDADGDARSLPIGLNGGDSSWEPTLPMPVVANLLTLLPGEHTPVTFRFSPQGSADWRIDDVYVDPHHK